MDGLHPRDDRQAAAGPRSRCRTAAALFPIFNDAAGWWYDPAGRHLDVTRTSSWVQSATERWALDGLSYWTVRLIDTSNVIGVPTLVLCRTQVVGVNRLSMMFGLFSIARAKNLTMPKIVRS